MTQISVGATSPTPHIHSDIGVGMTVVGPTTRLILPRNPESLRFGAEFRGNFALLQTFKKSGEIDGEIAEVPIYSMVALKGLRDPILPFGHPNNLGSMHFSPPENEEPRMFIGSFIVPPDWDYQSYITGPNNIPYQSEKSKNNS